MKKKKSAAFPAIHLTTCRGERLLARGLLKAFKAANKGGEELLDAVVALYRKEIPIYVARFESV